MKIAIFSDIHGNLPALKSIIGDIKKRKIDKTFFLGDLIGCGPQPKECIDLIIENNIEYLLGNHEIYVLKGTQIDEAIDENQSKHFKWVKSKLDSKELDYLNNIGYIHKEKIDNKIMYFSHFPMKDGNDDFPFEDFNILKSDILKDEEFYYFFGHEHKEKSGINWTCIGSSGCTIDENTHYYIISKNRDFNIERISLTYDRKKFIQALTNENYPDKNLIQKIFFGL